MNEQKNVIAEKGFTHILGPSPAIVAASGKEWDGWVLESCDVIKDGHTYYWYYHARGDKKLYPKEYRVGGSNSPDTPWPVDQAQPKPDPRLRP
ncbi:hypothetical protein ES703_44472 [subsurface metagenome]